MSSATRTFDFLVVGSGAGGAAAAWTLAQAGQHVALIEEGEFYRQNDFQPDLYSSISSWFRDGGLQTTRGKSIIPLLQGCCVGGSTVMNGAISYPLPQAAYQTWVEDQGFPSSIEMAHIEEAQNTLMEVLQIAPNWNYQSFPISKVLQTLGWSHAPMPRNAPGCQATGRCLQGCPTGGKLSMEKSLVPEAIRMGAELFSQTRAVQLMLKEGAVVGVRAQHKGQQTDYLATKGVLLGLGVIHTPQLLWASGLGHPEIGQHFQCHLSLGVAAKMPEASERLEGPPQGIEISEFSAQGIKLASQLLPPELLLVRTPLVGEDLVHALKNTSSYSSWTASLWSKTEGKVQRHWRGRAQVRFEPSVQDVQKAHQAVCHLTKLLLEMGAVEVYTGLMGKDVPLVVSSKQDLHLLENKTLHARNFTFSASHLFGTARMGMDKQKSVVDPNFKVREVNRLYVCDASLFPSAIGVNPQLPIMALGRLCAQRVMDLS